jgi:hypothetical protein
MIKFSPVEFATFDGHDQTRVQTVREVPKPIVAA